MDVGCWRLLLLCCIPTLHAHTVNSTLGKIRGQETTVLGKTVHVFQGIPFAKPPINTLRFKHPVPADPWFPDVKNATIQQASCYQYIPHKPNPLDQIPPLVSEDCLYLNIFTPTPYRHVSPKAVMVYLYGGAFISGSINAPMFDGRILASVNNVVVVTVNYRVGVLGFLYLDANTVPGNMGLMDQRLAIKWVHDNIRNFGGDSNRITIFGQSAGAGSVSHHLLSPLSQPFFTSAIIQSGSPLTSWDLLTDKEAQRNAIAIAKKANCSSTHTNAEIYECLNEQKPESLIFLQNGLVQGANVAFGPVVDGTFLPERPLAILEKGAAKNTSILLGVTQNEGSYFLFLGLPSVFKWQDNLTITNEQFMANLQAQGKIQGGSNATVDTLYQEYVLSRVESERDYVGIADAVLGDYSFKCPVTRFAGFLARSNPTYMYSFNHRLLSAKVPNWMGVQHGSELPFVWGHALDPKVNLTFTDGEKTLSRVMMSYWTNFAKFGDPNGENNNLTQWPRFDNLHERYLQLDVGSNLATAQGLRRRQCVCLYQTVPLVASLGSSKPANKFNTVASHPARMPPKMPKWAGSKDDGNTNRGGGSGPGPGRGGGGGGGGGGPPPGLGGLFAGGRPQLPNKGRTGAANRTPGPAAPALRPPGPRPPVTNNNPSRLSNGTTPSGGPPPPPPPQNKKFSIPNTTESSNRPTPPVHNSTNGVGPGVPMRHQPRSQPPPPPARPASGNISGRPSSMVGRPLPPPPPPHQNQPPPPPTRTNAPPPPSRPAAPPPPARTTSNQSGGTIGRSYGPPTARPPPPPARKDVPPPPPPHAPSAPSRPPPAPSSNPPPLRRPSSTSSYGSGGDDFEKNFRFHSMSELPPPEPFSNSNKTYPSRNPRGSDGSQRRAPPPPPPR